MQTGLSSGGLAESGKMRTASCRKYANRRYPALWISPPDGNIRECPRRTSPRHEGASESILHSPNPTRPRTTMRGPITMTELSHAKRTLALLAALLGLLLL